MRRHIPILALILFLALSANAQWPFRPAQVFGSGAGIGQTITSNVVQDREGFLWMGANNAGLYRFDGASATHWEVPGEFDQTVGGLYFDSLTNCLWAGIHGCLLRLNLSTWAYSQFSLPDSFGINKVDFTTGRMLRQGDALWALTYRGLVLFDLRQERFLHLFRETLPSALASNEQRANLFTDIRPDPVNPGLLWLGSEFGAASFDTKTYAFSHYEHPETVNTSDLRVVFPWIDGRIFFGSRDGFFIFTPNTGVFQKIFLADGLYLKSAVFSISQYDENRLLVTYNDGLALFDIRSNQIYATQKLRPDEAEAHYSFRFTDKQGRRWGSSRNGLACLTPIRQIGHTYPVPKPEPTIVPISWNLAELPETRVISIATSNSCNFLDCATGQMQKLQPVIPLHWNIPESSFKDENFRACVALDSRTALFANSKGVLFTGTPGDNRLIPFSWQLPQPTIVTDILKDKAGRIWIGTNSFGLFALQQNKGIWESRHFWEAFGIVDKTSSRGSVTNLLEDASGNIWKGSSGGFSVWVQARDTMLNFYWPHDNPLSVNEVVDFALGAHGEVWVVSRDKIVIVAPSDLNKGGTRILQTGIDYFNSEIESATGDTAGNVWLYGPRGLEKLDAATLHPRFYPNKFIGTLNYSDRIIPMSDGRLAFGCNSQVTIIHPDELERIKPGFARPYLQHIRVAGALWKQTADLYNLKKLYLQPNENVLTFEFGALDFDLPGYNKIFYKIDGINQDWVEADDARQATYVNLPSGKLIFRVKVKNADYGDSPNEYVLEIHIGTPWYRTAYAFTVYLSVLFGLLYWYYRLSLNRRLAQAETLRLTEMDAFKNRLFANFTHEFRTPLTLILGLTQKALRENKPLELADVKMIGRNGERILQLVNQILDLARLDAGMLRLQEEPADLMEELRYTAASFESLAALKGVKLVFETNAQTLSTVFDREKLRQVVSNLLSNAVKFTPMGGEVRLKFERVKSDGLRLEKIQKKPMIRINVSDTGVGIATEHLEHIFDRFYQIEKGERSSSEGTGIGLTIVKEFTELMGGRVSVTSEQGRGSTFLIELPLAIQNDIALEKPVVTLAPATQEQLLQVPETESQKSPAAPIILIVEDSPDVARFVARSLGDHFRFEFAIDGKAGVERALALTPDLIISDVMMPEMDGYALCRFLKQDQRTDHIPIILLTARADRESKLTGLRENADVYLAKPFEEEELQLQVQNLLKRQQVWRERFGQFPAPPVAAGVPGLRDAPHVPTPEEVFMTNLHELLAGKAFDAQYSVPKLCRDIGMSSSQLHRKLTALTGKSATEIIAAMRLEKAKQLLHDQGLRSIAEIAFDCGFDDPDYFSRAFSKRFGVSPSAFRKQFL